MRPTERIEFCAYRQEEQDGQTVYAGTFTIKFACYDPYGRMIAQSVGDYDDLGVAKDIVLAKTGIIRTRHMPPTRFTGVASDRQILLYNPGSARTHMKVRMSGNAGENGLSIYNAATRQYLKVINLTPKVTTDAGAYVEYDSRTGQTNIVNAGVSTLAFFYHDWGYLELAPSCPILRDVPISTLDGSSTVTSSVPLFTKELEGKYLRIGSEWKVIERVTDATHLETFERLKATTTLPTDIVTMNALYITGKDFKLDTLEFIYEPAVR